MNIKGFTKSKIGLFGGSFNPPHKGHLHISRLALKKLKLDKLLWLVTGKNPFKKNLKFLPLNKRIALSNKLIGGIRKMKAVDFESDLPSFETFYTIKKALRRFPYSKLYFITGSDSLFKFHKWKRYDFILKNVKMVVFARDNAFKALRTRTFIKYRNKIDFIWSKKIDISSTKIRSRKKFRRLQIIAIFIIAIILFSLFYN